MAIVLITHPKSDRETAQQVAISLQSAGHQTQCYSWTTDSINPQNGWDSLLAITESRLNSISRPNAYLILCLDLTKLPHWITWQKIADLATQLAQKNITLIPAILPGLEPAQPKSRWIQDLIILVQLNESNAYLSDWLYSHHISDDELLSQFKQLRQQNRNALVAS